MLVLIDNRQEFMEIDDSIQELVEKVVKAALDIEECEEDFEISVSFVDDDEMKALNKQYRNIDSTTDVLSFPLMDFDDAEPIENGSIDDFIDEELVLGDIVISTKKVADQAEEYGHSIERELAFLVAHGMLHLLGEDHDEPDKEAAMNIKQEKIMESIGIGR